MFRYSINAAVAALLFALATGASAATVNINTETGIAMETVNGFRSSSITRGIDLAGAQVTATFADADSTGSKSQTVVWQRFGSFTNGGANGENWSLFQGGSASVNITVRTRVMTSLLIDLTQSIAVNPVGSDPTVTKTEGASLFDINFGNEAPPQNATDSTAGSLNGFPFSFTAGEPEGTVEVTYSGAVNIAGAPAVGDLFTTMLIDFRRLNNGGFTGEAQYQSDQDTLSVAGDLRAVAPVPLPAGLPLLLAALGGLGLMRRSKRA